MVVADTMSKSVLKVSVSDSNTSNEDDSEVPDNELDTKSTDSSADDDSEASIDCTTGEPAALVTNEGWANSVAKILGSSKPKNKKTLVLSRAKKYSETAKSKKEEKPAFEVIGEVKKEINVPEESALSEPLAKKKKTEKSMIRVKPNILEKDRERLLAKIATKGVVQLFNAVRNQQKSIEKQLDRNDITESKKEKIMKKFDKRAFLDTLMGQTKSVEVDEESKTLKNENKPKWSALQDDFMMGAKMKDWDKEIIEE